MKPKRATFWFYLMAGPAIMGFLAFAMIPMVGNAAIREISCSDVTTTFENAASHHNGLIATNRAGNSGKIFTPLFRNSFPIHVDSQPSSFPRAIMSVSKMGPACRKTNEVIRAYIN